MKILHKSKRAVPPHPQVLEVISKLLSTTNDDLPDVLARFDSWKWPRSDLNAWIKVLNKFDTILEEIIRDYDVNKLQVNDFTPITKRILSEILRFERLLLENSTNRKMFNSYDRLNSLLFTADLDILILALNLLLRPSQQYSAQPSVSHALNISTPRLQSLAKRWPYLREYGISLAELASPSGNKEVEALPQDAREVNFTFYRTGSAGVDKEKKMDTDADTLLAFASPRKPPVVSPTSGAVHIHIDQQALESKGVMNTVADMIDLHSVPDDEKFDLLCHVRAAMVLTKGREADREKLVIIRLLAIAIFGHTHPESQAVSTLFLYEPDLVVHIADVLQVDHNIPVPVQTAAIAALDALARYRGKIQEVLTSVNAGVNHGILMALVRKTVADVSNTNSSLPHPFVEALLSFITFLASHTAGGNMVVGAGLIPLLIQVIENRLPHRLAVVSKTMQLVDNVLYSFTNAFQLFCASRGVEVLVERIEYEIDLDIQEYGDEEKSRAILGSFGQLPVSRGAVLKHTLRSMLRMMQSSGTAEGLRGLIDTSILKSIKKIIEYRGLFGPTIIPIAINVMATFVHNEPTSLAIIQETGLPEAFYKAIESGLEPAIEVIQAIPNAIGALCLNQAGQDQLAGRPSIIPGIFAIFTSERHVKVLLDKENAVLIGTAIDELIRHHPLLKDSVFESLRSTLSKIEELGNAYQAPEDIRQWYNLTPASALSVDVDVPMADAEVIDLAATTVAELPEVNPDSSLVTEEDATPKAHDNPVVSYIDILGRFLEGLFQHTPHCREFVTANDGLAYLGKFTALPCLPYDFANSVASDSLVQVMRTMTEVATGDTLLYLAKLVRSSLEDNKGFWEDIRNESKLLQLVDVTNITAQDGNQQFRRLITLHIRITLLSDVVATAGYAHGRAAISLLQSLMTSDSPQLVADLGALHRATIWETIVLKRGLISKGINVDPTPVASPLEGSPDQSVIPLPEQNVAASTLATATTNGVQPEPSVTPLPPPQKSNPKPGSPRENNAIALKHLMHGLPGSLAPFFQSMVKMFHARRNPDPALKKQITESSAIVADVMLKHISQEGFDDKLVSYTYYTVMLGLLTMLLVDERTSTNTLHTVELLAFYRAGGLDAVSKVCRVFMDTIKAVNNIRPEDRSEYHGQEIVHALGGLKVALNLIHSLISSKPLFESAQTALITTRDKKDTDPDYFEPHNFLVRLRLSALPLLRDLWTAKWFVMGPIGVTRSIVQSVLELTNGENEETKVEIVDSGAPGLTSNPRNTGPDETRIRQLTDMGFPRSAAERALLRTHNNVPAATELLLAHPFPLPPDPEPQEAPEPTSSILDVAINSVGGNEDADGDIADEAAAVSDPELAAAADEVIQSGVPLSQDEVIPPAESLVPQGRTSEEWKKALDEAREPLTAGISRQALLLVDEHLSLIFDLQVAFIRPTNSHQQQAVRDLVDDIKAFSPYAYDVHEQPLANRCRLLALVLCAAPSSVGQELRSTLMDSLLALLLSNPVTFDEYPTTPKWLAAHLLVTEALLTLAEEPRAIVLPKENDPILPEQIPIGPSLAEARSIVFDFCLRLLSIPNLPSDELLSILRLFVLLTRDNHVASQFAKKDGIALLFRRLRVSPVAGSSSYVAIILRHIAEDIPTVQSIVQQAIKRYFSQPRTHVVDVATFVRNCSAIALRNPQVFVEVTQSLCELPQPFSAVHQISLKPDVTPSADRVEENDSTEMQVDIPPSVLTSASNESLEYVVHFLIYELMRMVKAMNDPNPAASLEAPRIMSLQDLPSPSKPPLVPIDPKSPERFQYMTFLMQCLTELLFSYDSCKVALLSYSPKKRTQTPAKEAGSKHRSAALNFLLSDLISLGSINPQPDSEARNRITLCNWAMSVIVALCVDSSPSHELKDAPSDLISVRKFVLEAINRAIKDLLPSENVDSRYGRLLALADLCHRLLTVRFNTVLRKHQDDTPTHIAKVMLEKNFVATLTTALAEVDLNYPNVRGLVASILKPLEYLTKIAIKMSRASGKTKDSVEGKPESVDSLPSDEDEDGVRDTTREETPDLYRNSALGMYGGEMDDVHFSGDDEMDEDDEDEDEDVEMDFGEETGSEDTSNTEDDREEEGLHHDPHEPQEGWDDEDDEEEEDLIENEDDPNDDEDDEVSDDEGGEEVDEEMMWQDIRAEVDGHVGTGEDVDEDEETGDVIPVIRSEEDDERELMSDEDDFANDLGILEANVRGQNGEDIFGFADSFINSLSEPTRDGGGIFVPRRHRSAADNSGQFFGRGTNAQLAATTHPLLLDATATSNRSSTVQARNGRQTQRIVAGDTAEFLQTIEDLVGGGAVQLFQHLMNHGRGGGPEAIRVDVPAATLVNLERGFLQQRRPQGVISASVRVERAPRQGDDRPAGRDFDPMLTLQRWGEEIKVLHGDFVGERVSKLANHIVLALLPAAVEAAARRREAQIKAEQEAAAKEKELAEEAVKQQAEEGQATQEVPSTGSVPPQGRRDVPEADMDDEPTQIDHPMEFAHVSTSGVDTEMLDVPDAPSPPPPPMATEVDVGSISSTDHTTGEDAVNPTIQTVAQAESSSIPERITVMIHGSVVDITDTGIDPTFLEALPDDMREEVLNQHVRDQRAARIERPPDSQISSEFLDALPPEIRAEIIQQERLEQSRRRTEETATSGGPGVATGPAEIDPASFIASLDPQLRQVVLLDSDDGFIQSLPSHMIAEAGVYRDSSQPRRRLGATSGAQRPTLPQKVRLPASHDAIQLLDRSGITILVRLLFFPQVLRKNLLFKVLVNLCENAKTRTELFNLLLNILQDGTGDLAAVDKSFAQMSVRNSKTPQTPKSAGKQRASLDYFTSLAIPHLPIDAVPDLVAQRCLESLTFIVSANEISSLFFLTEHELPAGLRKATSKKGKGKERQLPQTHYPIVLLLGLLDRQSLLKAPSIMESVVALLATVTRPLTSLRDNLKDNRDLDSAGKPSTSLTLPAHTINLNAISLPVETVSATPGFVQTTTLPVADTSQPSDAMEQEASGPDDGPPPAETQSLAPAPEANKKHDLSTEATEERILLANPPQIPHNILRLIVNILTTGECSGRTFQQTLALIQHLSYIPDARDVIAQELKSKAQEFGQNLYSDLDELAAALQDSKGDVLVSSVASKFSPASSVQAKLLRVLKTIDYMYTPKSPPSSSSHGNEDAEKVQSIYEAFRFAPLWQRLGDCLSVIEEKPQTEHIATVLLPLIEALMVVCKYVGSRSPINSVTRVLRASASPRSPTTPHESIEDLFVTFTDAHRKVLNLMVRNNPSLMSGSFSLLVHNPRVLDFDNKRNYFNQQLHRRPHAREHHSTLTLNVRRARVFEDSFQYLQRKTGDQIKYGKLSVRFYDEEGVDAGGVTREWFQILARQMFDPNNALFQPCAADRLTYQPNKNSWVNPEHLSFFKFVGRVIGKAIYDGRLLDAYFARSLYRQILGKPVDYKDVEWVDPEYYNSLCWILENDPTALDLTFSVEADEFGVNRIVPLKESGESVTVTQENKREFVQLSAQYRLHSSIKEQIGSLLAGFYEIIPKDLITIFNEQELELLISGTPDIDVDEWRAATEYNGYSGSDPAIVWWWRALKSFNRDERAKVLSFATGTSKVPLGGFVDLQGVQGTQRFSIHRAYGESDRLPQAHTCFNQIDLPQYSSYEMLRHQLLLSINEGGEGFGFA